VIEGLVLLRGRMSFVADCNEKERRRRGVYLLDALKWINL
jgi:hypothetical protein